MIFGRITSCSGSSALLVGPASACRPSCGYLQSLIVTRKASLFDVPDLAEQLAKAASAPLVKWMGVLHPGQTRLVRRSYTGPARVRGPAGTGKSVVMLHRAAWLAETRPGRILVTSL